jgi:hypothetical protein
MRSLAYGKSNNSSVFGLCKDNTLFQLVDGKVRICPLEVKQFSVVSEWLLMVKTMEGMVRFISIADWQPISIASSYLRPPTNEQMLVDFITKRPSKFFSHISTDAWLSVSGKKVLRLQAVAAAPPSGLCEEITYQLLDRIEIDSNVANLKFTSLLFLNRFEDASLFLQQQTDYAATEAFLNSVLCSILLLPIDERTQIHLKASAMRAFNGDKAEHGAILMRIAGLDKEAADHLIELGEYGMAIRFLRTVVNDGDRRLILFKLGIRKFEQRLSEDSLTLFAAAQEYHAVLYVMTEMDLIVDSYNFMRFLKEEDLLKEVGSQEKRMFKGLPDLNELCEDIEIKYSILLKELGIE